MDYQEILEECDQAHYLYNNTNTNHIPMAARALNKLNGSFDQISNFITANKPMIVQNSSSSVEITDANWKEYIGKKSNFASFQKFFGQQFEDVGATGTLRTFVDPLMPGVATGAFHALIRESRI